jgi:beta-lactamase class A
VILKLIMGSASPVDEIALLSELGLTGAAYAAPVDGGEGVGFEEHDPVSPASVMKIQIGLAVEMLIAVGELDGVERRLLDSRRRTPGPVGVSLMRDDVSMSLRDLVVAMLTVSDNVATDELIAVVGLEQINRLTARLGLVRTEIVSTLQGQLDGIARDAGFADFRALAAHDPDDAGPPSDQEIRNVIATSDAINPGRGTRTTAAETVRLLRLIWTDTAAPSAACARVRWAMAHQLTRQRIASGFDSNAVIAAKSGGLLGVVRNEAGVVTFADGDSYAVAVFTRRPPDVRTDPARIDSAIGTIARSLIDRLRNTTVQ